MKKLMLLGLALVLGSTAFALPTVYGPSGGFLVPDTGIQDGVTMSVSTNIDEAFGIPLVQLNWGVKPNLELGAGFNQDDDDETVWNVNAKYALPWTILQGKLAAALSYSDQVDDEETEWHALLVGSWPVFTASTFTAGVNFSHHDDDDVTAFLLGLKKEFKNGTALGLEYYFNSPEDILDYYVDADGDFGTAYIDFPINEMLSGRVALVGINQNTEFFTTIGAKF